MKILSKIALVFLISSIFLFSCAKSGQTEENSSENGPDTGYPINASTGYPDYSQSQSNENIGPEFKINKPVKTDSSVISGIGPKDLPIILVDVSNLGEKISETVINKSGVFSFNIDVPLIQNHTIGIQLGDLTGTDFDPDDFIYSQTYYDKPMIGILFDIAIVE